MYCINTGEKGNSEAINLRERIFHLHTNSVYGKFVAKLSIFS